MQRVDAVQAVWQFSILRADHAPFQHRSVMHAAHEELVTGLRKMEQQYSGVWRLESAPFPLVFIQIFGTDGASVAGLRLDATNYPHRALSVLLTDASCRKFANQVWGKPGDTGRQGVFLNPQAKRFWFCTPGTDEYHGRYHDVEPFDRVRDTPEVTPLEVILRCIRYLDIPKTTAEVRKLQAQGVP